jgi:hypothetical protein
MSTNTQAPSSPTPGLAPAAGVVLIVVGALLYAAQSWGLALFDWGRGWPLAVVAVGVTFLATALLGGRDAAALAYPGCIVTTVGTILLVQSVTDQWQTWAYAWALIPTAVGAAKWLHGLRTGEAELRAHGRRTVEVGLLLFAGFAAFFELVLNLSGFLTGGAGATGLALLLVLCGGYLLLRGRTPAGA